MNNPTRWVRRTRNVHYWVTALLVLALVPCLRGTGLPLKFDWGKIVSAYWLVLAAQSVFVATLMFLLASSPQDTLLPITTRFRRDKVHILLIFLFFGILSWLFTWLKALILTMDAVALLE